MSKKKGRGAPPGNRNAAKEHPARINVNISLNYQRQQKIIALLHRQGVTEPTTKDILDAARGLALAEIDRLVE